MPQVLNKIPATFYEEQSHQIAVSIPFNDLVLHAHLYIPEQPLALVIITHGNGSSRFSPKNNFVARELYSNNMAALLVDLLSAKEDSEIENRFDIPLLTERLGYVTNWAKLCPELRNLPVGYFGASTGAASAIQAAANLANKIEAIVCAGGRLDLTGTVLPVVTCPTLLIAGGLDNELIKVNHKAFQALTCKKRFVIVNSASHLFEEPDKLHIVSGLSFEWFEKYLVQRSLVR